MIILLTLLLRDHLTTLLTDFGYVSWLCVHFVLHDLLVVLSLVSLLSFDELLKGSLLGLWIIAIAIALLLLSEDVVLLQAFSLKLSCLVSDLLFLSLL